MGLGAKYAGAVGVGCGSLGYQLLEEFGEKGPSEALSSAIALTFDLRFPLRSTLYGSRQSTILDPWSHIVLAVGVTGWGCLLRVSLGWTIERPGPVADGSFSPQQPER